MPTSRSRVGVTLFACAAATVAWTYAAAGQQKKAATPAASVTNEWPTYGHDPGGMRYSPVAQITTANVAQLQPAWVYHMKPAGASAPAGRGGATAGFASGETTPLVINGTMYVSTPYGRV